MEGCFCFTDPARVSFGQNYFLKSNFIKKIFSPQEMANSLILGEEKCLVSTSVQEDGILGFSFFFF